MNSIAFDGEDGKHFSSRIENFFCKYRISEILRKSNAYKNKGFSVVDLMRYLFCLVFRNRSMFLDMQSGKAPGFGKDTVYRFKNTCHINWMRFTTLLAARIIRETVEPLTDEKRRNAFVIDDTILRETAPVKWNCWLRFLTTPVTNLPVDFAC